jgi:hypothetical protein
MHSAGALVEARLTAAGAIVAIPAFANSYVLVRDGAIRGCKSLTVNE